MPPRFQIDPDNAPWWAFLVILGLCLGLAGGVMAAMTIAGGSPERGIARLIALVVAGVAGYAMRWRFGNDFGRRSPPDEG